MTRVCAITGKGPLVGNNVSHANNKTKRRFLPNLQYHRFWLESEGLEGESKGRYIKLRVSTRGMRIIDKLGLKDALLYFKGKDQRQKHLIEE